MRLEANLTKGPKRRYCPIDKVGYAEGKIMASNKQLFTSWLCLEEMSYFILCNSRADLIRFFDGPRT